MHFFFGGIVPGLSFVMQGPYLCKERRLNWRTNYTCATEKLDFYEKYKLNRFCKYEHFLALIKPT